MAAKCDELKLRVSEREIKAWRWCAEQSGLSLSAWVRIKLNGTDLVHSKR
jgi:hypothetical protein